MQSSDRPIFVVGCPRSGTTLFRVMLHAHPRIAIPPESKFLMPAYRRRARFQDLELRENRQLLADWITQREDNGFPDLQLDPETVAAEIVDGPPTLGSAMGIVFRAYAQKFGKDRWGDKRPSYYGFMDELDHLFPDAQFIHVIRDGRAAVASIKRKTDLPPKGDGLKSMATWIQAIDACRNSGKKLGQERYYEVRYEDIIADPEREMRAVCAFLGEEFHPDMCLPEQIAAQVTPANWSHQKQILRGVNDKSVELWREELEPWEVATLERAARGRLRSLGYELSGIGGRAPLAKVLLVGLLHRRFTAELAARRISDRRALADSEQPVASLLTKGQLELAALPQPRMRQSIVPKRVRHAVRWRLRRLRSALLSKSPSVSSPESLD
jgi:hypothetical protein